MATSVDKFHDECGVFGVYGDANAMQLTYMGLYALQHRGQESAGIVVSDGEKMIPFRGMGLVSKVFKGTRVERLNVGHLCIGHVRYSTAGASLLKNAQPFVAEYSRGSIAIAHNGNLINYNELCTRLEDEGSIFQSSMDTEIILHLMARSQKLKFIDTLIEALKQVKGAYSLLVMRQNALIGARDPNGLRPLVLGKINNSYVLSSETCALDLIKAEYVRDIEPGEIVIIDKDGLRSIKPWEKTDNNFCIFEYIYFSRPDSVINGKSVHQVRKAFGAQLAREVRIEADIVIPVPDSGVSAALGYSQASGIPFDYGLIRNRYVGRTFIQPMQIIRDLGVEIKLNPVPAVLAGKRVIVIDDSLVRGTTSRKIVGLLRHAGAKEIHFGLSSPPIAHSCFFGIDTPNRKDLIAADASSEQIRKYLQADSLSYLSHEGMLKAVDSKEVAFCTACFNVNYPLKFNYKQADSRLPKKIIDEEQLELV